MIARVERVMCGSASSVSITLSSSAACTIGFVACVTKSSERHRRPLAVQLGEVAEHPAPERHPRKGRPRRCVDLLERRAVRPGAPRRRRLPVDRRADRDGGEPQARVRHPARHACELRAEIAAPDDDAFEIVGRRVGGLQPREGCERVRPVTGRRVAGAEDALRPDLPQPVERAPAPPAPRPP